MNYLSSDVLNIPEQGILDYAMYRPLRMLFDKRYQILSPLALRGAFSKVRIRDRADVDFVHTMMHRTLSRYDVDYVIEADQTIMDFLTDYANMSSDRLQLLRRMIRKILDNNRFKGLIARSRKAKARMLLEYGLDANRVIVVPVPMPVSGPRTPEEKVRVLYVGYDFFRKGGDILLEAFARLKRLYDDKVELIFVGSVPANYQELLTSTKACHYPQLPHDSLFSDIMPRCDVLALPSRAEAYGITILEAMSHGLAVLTRQNYATHEMIQHGINGVILRDLTVADTFTKLKDLVDDEALRLAIGKHAVDTIARRHNPETIAMQMRAAYDSLLSN